MQSDKDVSKHSWEEKDEKVLLDSVDWVESTFPKGSEALNALGGKWGVVSIRMSQMGLNVSDEACKSRFFKIKRREQVKKDGDTEIVSLLDTDFPQVKDDKKSGKLIDQPAFANLQRRVSDLEADVSALKKRTNSLVELNDNLVKFFDTFGVKVPKRDV